LASAAGHDLVIEAEVWSATLELDPADAQLRATVDATSLRVRDGKGGVKPLSDSDRAEIQKNIQEKVLKTDRNPEIAFVSTAISGQDTRFWRIAGQLTIAGTATPVEIEVTADSGGDETVLTATLPVVQTSFGIKPYSAMMGALKVADTVNIRAEVRLPSAPAG
jgi:polyisoprenoid-binding protein YceI